MNTRWHRVPWMHFCALLLMLSVLLGACGTPTASPQTTTSSVAVAAPTDVPTPPATAVATSASDLVEIAPTSSTGVATDELEGEININLSSTDTQTWGALAKAYMEKHPKVKVTVELKSGQGYQEWVRAQFASGTPTSSLWNPGNLVQDLFAEKKLLDLSPYLDRVNPYTDKPWRDGLDANGVEQMRDTVTGGLFNMNTEGIQILWFYNMDAFEKAGILEEAQTLAGTERNQPTWSQFIGWCDKLKTAGYLPVAIEGDFNALWTGRAGWMARMYLDQYTRDEIQEVRVQPGDWNFREGVDDKWQWDVNDPNIDEPSRVRINLARQMAAMRDGKQRVDEPAFRELYTNFKQFSDSCAQPGWIGTADAYPLFLTQKAAIRLDGSFLLTRFAKDIKSLSEGKYIAGRAAEGEPTPTPLPVQSVSAFEIGSFNNPTMEGPNVVAPARTLEGNVGFWSIPTKDQKQNNLEVDFLMYTTSPEGFNLYLENKLDLNNGNGGISGPPMVKGVEIPAAFASQFAQLKPLGQSHNNAGNYRTRGIHDYQPSVREWVDLAQQFYTDKITLDEFLQSYQASVDRLFPEILDHLKLTPADLDQPEKKPAQE